ncbi:DUF4259 domain-containing protein [Tenacibaculum maritimum]|uniref:DUF4259 domain-containing protein n=1 Tax=Tenacibaculum maritimum TaxID=107401 RepID=UPI0004220C40|nr:DUF4259 domain-containing protein [Tenacibaculum maritimum]CAA0235031.1 hypothetical protein NACSLCCMFF_510005 [Tenacibaculum maritimum]
MGAWGVGNFDNDSAKDWLYNFIEHPTKSFLERTLETIFKEKYLDFDIATEALASIEVISLVMGNSKEDKEELENINIEALKNSFDKILFDKSIKCINRILDKNDNELYELWEESEYFENWKKVVLNLKEQIQNC